MVLRNGFHANSMKLLMCLVLNRFRTKLEVQQRILLTAEIETLSTPVACPGSTEIRMFKTIMSKRFVLKRVRTKFLLE